MGRDLRGGGESIGNWGETKSLTKEWGETKTKRES